MISDVHLGLSANLGLVEVSEFRRQKNVVRADFQGCQCHQIPTAALQWVSIPTKEQQPRLLLAQSPTACVSCQHHLQTHCRAKPGLSCAANTLQATEAHCGHYPCATHIDQVLLEAFPQVLNECSFAGEVFQQDKVLHPDAVPGGQSALHGQPDAVGSQSLQTKAQGSGDGCGFAGSSPSPQEPQSPLDNHIKMRY